MFKPHSAKDDSTGRRHGAERIDAVPKPLENNYNPRRGPAIEKSNRMLDHAASKRRRQGVTRKPHSSASGSPISGNDAWISSTT